MKRYFFLIAFSSFILSSCSKEEGEGGRSSISGTLEGIISSNSRAEVTEVTCVPEDEIKAGDYWLLNTPNSNDDYYIWYNDLSVSSSAPVLASRIAVQVDYSSFNADDNVTIAINTENAINNISGAPFTVVRNNDILTITTNVRGSATDADNATSKFGVDVKTQGKNQIIEQNGVIANEDVFIIYGDDDDIQDDDVKSNFDGTFEFNNLREGSYRIFAYSEDPALPNPLIPVFESVNIGGNEDVNIGTISITKKDD